MKLSGDKLKTLPFYLIVAGFFLIRISPDFLSRGIFMDGLIYSTVSKNLSEGTGTFWNPHFTATCLPEFHEHPPLALGLQSLFFSVFGDGRLTEKIYSFLTYVIVALIITRIWKISGFRNAWLPLFLWCIIPVVSWACPNNLLENTLTIFTTLSLLFFIESTNRKKILFLFLSGVMLSFGFLTKGFVALFPWSLPFIFWLLIRKTGFKSMATGTLVMVFSTIVPLAVLLLIPEAAASLKKYIDIQVIGSLKEAMTVSSRFYITGRLISELLPSLIIVLLLVLYGYKSKEGIKTSKGNLKSGMALIVTGLCGVLPIMISMKQSGFYILPSLPFFATGFALLIKEQSEFLTDRIKAGTVVFRYLSAGSCLLFLVAVFLVFLNLNRFSRDEVKLTDTSAILPSIPAGTTINIMPDMYEDWSLHGYYARMKNISLDPDLNNKREFLLMRKEELSDTAMVRNYKKADIGLKEYQLYSRK